MIADLSFKDGKISAVLIRTVAIIIVQSIGAFLGTLLTFVMTMYFRKIDGTAAQTTLPFIAIMCPSFIEHDFAGDGANTKMYCNVADQHPRIVVVEFIGSLVFVLSWLILRNYKVHDGQIDQAFQNLLKPVVVMLAFYGGNAISGLQYQTFRPQPHNIYGGFKNPTLALQLFVWN